MKMKSFNTSKIIGIDHGYGNMKTANFCFPTGIIAYDSEPLFTACLLYTSLAKLCFGNIGILSKM